MKCVSTALFILLIYCQSIPAANTPKDQPVQSTSKTSAPTTGSLNGTRCSDGMPAIFPCNQQRVCDGDPALACENIQGSYFCCDPRGASRATTPSSSTSLPSAPPSNGTSSRLGVPSLLTTSLGSQLSLTTPLISALPLNDSTTPATEAMDPKSGQCADQRPNVCGLISDMCRTPKYHSFVAEVCPRSCNLCPEPTECKDKYLACGGWARNNFCNFVIYREETKRRLCGATCCMCNRNSLQSNPFCPVSNSSGTSSPPTSATSGLPSSSAPSTSAGLTLLQPSIGLSSPLPTVQSGDTSYSPTVSTLPPPAMGLNSSMPSTLPGDSSTSTETRYSLTPPLGSSSPPPSPNISSASTPSLLSLMTQPDNSSTFSTTTQQTAITSHVNATTQSPAISSSTGAIRPRAGQGGSNGRSRTNQGGDGPMGQGGLEERENTESMSTTRRPRAGQ